MTSYQSIIELLLQSSLNILRQSAEGRRFFEQASVIDGCRASLNLVKLPIEKTPQKSFGEQIYQKHNNFTKAIQKTAIHATSWTFDANTQQFEEENVKTAAKIDRRWKFGLHKRNLRNLADCNRYSLFIPNIGITDVKDEEIKQQLLQMSTNISENIRKQVKLDKGEFEWQNALYNPISGFGVDACQLYIKSGITVTLFHDELGWSTAVNYMTQSSRGAAIWIGVDLKELEQHFTKTELLKWYTQLDVNAWILQLAELRNRLFHEKQQVPEIRIVWQTPSSIVFSPAGCGHCVITVGDYVEQLAMNYSASEHSIRECLEFWSEFEPQRIKYNSGMATEHVIPCLWLRDSKQLDLGETIAEKCRKLHYVFSSTQNNIQWAATNKEPLFCSQCERHCLWVLCDNFCEDCLLNSSPWRALVYIFFIRCL
jgi:hypothetical protein